MTLSVIFFIGILMTFLHLMTNYVNNTTLKTLLDKHAPVRSKSIKIKPPAPWMSPEIINAKVRH